MRNQSVLAPARRAALKLDADFRPVSMNFSRLCHKPATSCMYACICIYACVQTIRPMASRCIAIRRSLQQSVLALCTNIRRYNICCCCCCLPAFCMYTCRDSVSIAFFFSFNVYLFVNARWFHFSVNSFCNSSNWS